MRHLTCDYLSVYTKLRKICETLVCSVLSRHDHVGQRSTRQTTRPYNSLSAGHASQHSNKMQNIKNKLTPSTKQAQMNTLRGHIASCLNLATWDSEVAKSCGQAIAKRDFHGSFDPSWSELAVWVWGTGGAPLQLAHALEYLRRHLQAAKRQLAMEIEALSTSKASKALAAQGEFANSPALISRVANVHSS